MWHWRERKKNEHETEQVHEILVCFVWLKSSIGSRQSDDNPSHPTSAKRFLLIYRQNLIRRNVCGHTQCIYFCTCLHKKKKRRDDKEKVFELPKIHQGQLESFPWPSGRVPPHCLLPSPVVFILISLGSMSMEEEGNYPTSNCVCGTMYIFFFLPRYVRACPSIFWR